jgi:hypothetical protein
LFTSYQSPQFFKNLCAKNNLEVLKHIPGEVKKQSATRCLDFEST